MSIEERVMAVIQEISDLRLPDISASLQESGADSLDAVMIVMAIEEEFSIVIPDDQCEDWNTVADIIATVEMKLGGG